MNKDYQPKIVEAKWLKVWHQTKLYEADNSSTKPKYYELEFFPYPSGVTMHVGHVRNYVISDVHGRLKRMQGYNVLHPMGWDAFGLPAENQAIKTGQSPRASTDANIEVFKRQLDQVGLSYDWSREVDSSKPDYYRWTQWIFLLLHKRKLAYKAEALVNWCPHDKTVLANEQVIKTDGKNVCERCGHEVEKRLLNQWFFKITDYADRLLEDLKTLDWPTNVKTMQENWIGRSEGATIKFAVDGSKDAIEVFTTRIDTIYGATFMVLAPEHSLVKTITTPEQKSAIEAYVKKTSGETEIERQGTDRTKTGVFTGAYAINPSNQEKIPVWIADYVLMGYGTGAIMAVPAHDERDYEFAQKFELPVKTVIEPVLVQETGSAKFRSDQPAQDSHGIIAIVKHWSDDKYLGLSWQGASDWGTLLTGGIDNGHTPEQTVLKEIQEETGFKNAKIVKSLGTIHSKYYHEPKQLNRFGHAPTFYVELQDDARDNISAEEQNKHQLHWLSLPELKQFLTATSHQKAVELLESPTHHDDGMLTASEQFDGMTSVEARQKITQFLQEKGLAEPKVNYKMRDWLISRQRYWGAPIPIIYCKKCGVVPVPEDQLPVVLPEVEDYHPDGSGRSPLAKVKDWVNVDCPTCGGPAERETDTMDGFACSSWYFLRFADPHNQKMPFDKAIADYWMPVDTYVGGVEHATMHLLYARFWMKVFADAGLVSANEPFKQLRNQGIIGAADGRKMGKRYGNVVTPDDIIDQGYGADALRLYEAFIGPYNQGVDWNPNGIDGTFRFLKRVWALVYEFCETKDSPSDTRNAELETALLSVLHRTIKKVTDDIGDFGFNTAVAALMELVNELYKIRVDLPLESAPDTWQIALATLVQLMAPFAPFVSEELWQTLGGDTSVHVSEWPKYEEKYLKQDLIEVPVQVNGKLRDTIIISPEMTDEEVEKMALQSQNVKHHLEGKEVVKTIVVPRKLVNFVIK